MKKAFILLLCFSLCGCSITNNNNNEFQLETKPYITQQQTNSVQNITIYVYNETTSRLESKIVPVTIYPDQTRAEAALDYLLSTPQFEFSLNSYGVPDYSIIVAGGIASVKIANPLSHNDNNHLKCFALHFSIVNTLCSIDGINYANVYAGNNEMAGDMYIGPSKFLQTNINDHYVDYYGSDKNNINNGASQKSIIVYYGEKGQNLIVPEQHHVYIDTKNYDQTVNTILSKMSKAPTNTSDLISSVNSAFNINKLSVNNNKMSIDFTVDPCSSVITNQAITYSAIYNTITSIYPQITSIEFSINEVPVIVNGITLEESGTVTKDTFPNIIGNSVSLYMTQNSMDALSPVNRYLSVASGTSIVQILNALMTGPTSYDNSYLISPIFGDLNMDDLISAKAVNDIAILNFDTGFYEAIKNLSKDEETIMIYAIVNTLTAREHINRVQFLINNQSFDTINGHIYYSNPLISNPGLILK